MDGEAPHRLDCHSGNARRVEQLAAGDAKEILPWDTGGRHSSGLPRCGSSTPSVAHQVQSNRARSRSRSARTSGVGSGDLRTSARRWSSAEHPGVDLVGLRRQGREPSDALGNGDQHIPARELEAVVEEAATVIDSMVRSAQARLGGDPPDEACAAHWIGRGPPSPAQSRVLAQHMHVEPLSRPVQSGRTTSRRASSVLVELTVSTVSRVGPLFMTISW